MAGQGVRRGDEMRQAIVAAAIEFYSHNGARRTNLADIAMQVGTSPANILYHFGSKAGLITAMVEELEARRIAEMEPLAERGGVPMLQGLAAYARLTEESPNLAALALMCSVENLGADEPAHQYFLKQGERDRTMLRKGLQAGMGRGELRPDIDLDATIEEIRAFMAGAWLIWLLDPGHASLRHLYDGYFSKLIRELRRDKNPSRRQPSGRPPTRKESR
jgi:AcrR family transcriptional regulator